MEVSFGGEMLNAGGDGNDICGGAPDGIYHFLSVICYSMCGGLEVPAVVSTVIELVVPTSFER